MYEIFYRIKNMRCMFMKKTRLIIVWMNFDGWRKNENERIKDIEPI